METIIHKTSIRQWGEKETLVTVKENGRDYNFEISGDLTEAELIAIAEDRATKMIARENEEPEEVVLLSEKEQLEADIASLTTQKEQLESDVSDLETEKTVLEGVK